VAEPSQPTPPTVLIVNGLQDTIDMLRLVLEDAGFRVVDMQARDVRRGEADLAAAVALHRAAAVLYDVAIPYAENWRAVQACLNDPALADVGFVLTTTNKRALEGIVGTTGTLEIIGKPYDLFAVVDAVRQAAKMPPSARAGDRARRRGQP
jgi:CheY-like chemotaxis protein